MKVIPDWAWAKLIEAERQRQNCRVGKTYPMPRPMEIWRPSEKVKYAVSNYLKSCGA